LYNDHFLFNIRTKITIYRCVAGKVMVCFHKIHVFRTCSSNSCRVITIKPKCLFRGGRGSGIFVSKTAKFSLKEDVFVRSQNQFHGTALNVSVVDYTPDVSKASK